MAFYHFLFDIKHYDRWQRTILFIFFIDRTQLWQNLSSLGCLNPIFRGFEVQRGSHCYPVTPTPDRFPPRPTSEIISQNNLSRKWPRRSTEVENGKNPLEITIDKHVKLSIAKNFWDHIWWNQEYDGGVKTTLLHINLIRHYPISGYWLLYGSLSVNHLVNSV